MQLTWFLGLNATGIDHAPRLWLDELCFNNQYQFVGLIANSYFWIIACWIQMYWPNYFWSEEICPWYNLYASSLICSVVSAGIKYDCLASIYLVLLLKTMLEAFSRNQDCTMVASQYWRFNQLILPILITHSMYSMWTSCEFGCPGQNFITLFDSTRALNSANMGLP